MKHCVIYVPGILDDVLKVQSMLMLGWWLHGVRPVMQPMPWTADDFESQVQVLLDKIDLYADRGYKVSLVGASAGASGVLQAYARRPNKISRLVYICGKINHPETVSAKTYTENPAFKQSLATLSGVLGKLTTDDKAKMRSWYSPADGTVPYDDTVINGVVERRLPALKHGWAIIYAISLGSWSLLRSL